MLKLVDLVWRFLYHFCDSKSQWWSSVCFGTSFTWWKQEKLGKQRNARWNIWQMVTERKEVEERFIKTSAISCWYTFQYWKVWNLKTASNKLFKFLNNCLISEPFKHSELVIIIHFMFNSVLFKYIQILVQCLWQNIANHILDICHIGGIFPPERKTVWKTLTLWFKVCLVLADDRK